MFFNVEGYFRDLIEKNGGFYNCHSHLDRAYTLTDENFNTSNKDLKQKWHLVDTIKKEITVKQLTKNMMNAVTYQKMNGAKGICTFLDFDEVSESKPYEAFENVKGNFGALIDLKCANQTLKGILDEKNRYYFDMGSAYCDIIGSLPARDVDPEAHLDIAFKRAKQLSKKVHVHVDQFNSPTEKETELVLNKIVEHGLEGQVSLIHCISLSSHPRNYRNFIYDYLKETGTSIICCPRAWLDSPRKEELQPVHNSITPVDEMLEYDIQVGIGTDNISDLMLPFNDGDMYKELETLAISTRLYDVDKLIAIATNGKNFI